MIQKAILGSVAALTMVASVITLSAPAQAQHHHDGNAVPFIAGAIGGLAVGSIIAGSTQPRYYDDVEPEYGHCWYQRQRVYDDYGDYVGHRRVRFAAVHDCDIWQADWDKR
eukprot:gene7650-7713_t